ncbi:MAG: TVP38/TMEM64 family protein [Deltaproteobacteria bacterium]|nr:TVP38/TMEM64 family protein [Deltaproteobacteria bacterium]
MTRSGVLFALLAAAVVLAVLVFGSALREIDAEAVAVRVRAAGPLGPAALLLLLVLQCVVAPLPSEPVMVAAGFVYGPVFGFAISWLGVVLGAGVCFGLARRFGRPLVLRFVHARHLDALDAYVADRGVGAAFALVLSIRLLAFMSFDIVSYGCGLTGFPLRWFVLASGLGVVPKAFAFTYAGASAASRPGWLDAVILAGSFGVVFAVPWLARRLSRRRATGD